MKLIRNLDLRSAKKKIAQTPSCKRSLMSVFKSKSDLFSKSFKVSSKHDVLQTFKRSLMPAVRKNSSTLRYEQPSNGRARTFFLHDGLFWRRSSSSGCRLNGRRTSEYRWYKTKTTQKNLEKREKRAQQHLRVAHCRWNSSGDSLWKSCLNSRQILK